MNRTRRVPYRFPQDTKIKENQSASIETAIDGLMRLCSSSSLFLRRVSLMGLCIRRGCCCYAVSQRKYQMPCPSHDGSAKNSLTILEFINLRLAAKESQYISCAPVRSTYIVHAITGPTFGGVSLCGVSLCGSAFPPSTIHPANMG